MRRMTPAGALTLCLSTAIAMSGLAVASASAGEPELGRCVHTKANGGPKYKTRVCDTTPAPNGAPNHDFEWFPGVVKSRFTATGGASTFETAGLGLVKVACKKQSETGAFSGLREVKNVVMTFTHCRSGVTGCGNAHEESVTKPLEGVLGFKTKALKRVLLHLFPAGHVGPFAEFKCATATIVVSGSLLGPVPDDLSTRTHQIKYLAAGGEQGAETFEGEPNNVLMASLDGGAPERAGLTLTTVLTGEEAIEVNIFV
jgi:hypothetical protein